LTGNLPPPIQINNIFAMGKSDEEKICGFYIFVINSFWLYHGK
jgi:hypothetical protein